MPFQLTGSDAEVVVHLDGEIDRTRSLEVADAFEEAFRAGLPVRVDASGLTFIDSSGMTALLAAKRVGEFTIVRGNPRLDRLIEITGLEHLYV